MYSRKRRTASAALILCGTLAFASAFQYIEAEDQTSSEQTDSLTLSASQDGENLVLNLSGILKENEWYYKVTNITVTYADQSSQTIYYVTSAGNHYANATIDYQNEQQGTILSENTDTKEVSSSVSIPLNLLKSRDFTLSFNGETVTSQSMGIEQPVQTAEPVASEAPVSLTPNTDGKITVDAVLNDWNAVPQENSGNSSITWWKTARDTTGNLYFCFTGSASTQWYGDYNWFPFTISQNGKEDHFQISAVTQKIPGSLLQIDNQANGNTAAPYYVEGMIPSSNFTDPAFTINFANTDISADEIPVLNGNDVTPQKDLTYHGITIDGQYDDWAGVTKYDAKCPNTDHPNCLSQAAMVFDNDHVYIYIKEGKGGTASGAGSHSDGNFEILTDLGNRALLHFHDDGTVTSNTISNIQSRHVGSEWEVEIDAGQLPSYHKTISFGLYDADGSDPKPFVKDVANLNGEEHKINDGSGIQYDGDYGDWKDFPHSLIEYATSGTQEERVDGEGALYGRGSTVYGHVYTEMPAHLQEKGGEFADDVKIRLNKKDEFSPRLVSADSQGNINWSPMFNADGMNEYYIVDTNGWASAKTLDELNDGKHGNAVYGKMTMTIDSSSRDECEFYLDEAKLAEKFNMDEHDIQYVEAQFGRIGQQWLATTSTSSGPWIGASLCAVIAGIGYVLMKHVQ